LVRQKILDLFNTSQNEYDVVFVMNATHGLKLLAETFNFNEVIEIDDCKSEESSHQSSYFAYLNDNHTSVIGLREIVWYNHPLTETYCLFEDENLKFNAKLVDSPFQYKNNSNKFFKNRSLLVYPAQSNFNGRKYDLDIINDTQNNGLSVNISNEEKKLDSEWFVCLDTASYVSTSELDLTINKPDFLVVSFYKIFGFPTGMFQYFYKKN
jgi:molybdenum cofactor sulfurtransferase